MRLDKFLTSCGVCSRTEAARAARAGEISVNGVPAVRADVGIDPDADTVVFKGQTVADRREAYLLLHKPEGYVSATEDGRDPTVLTLLPDEWQRVGLFPCGRLDKNTTGLMLLTNDGELSHRLLSPARHVEKEYRFTLKFPLSDADVTALEAGVDIGGYVTAPCRVIREGEREGRIVLSEGKYHQIKLMMEAVHNQVRILARVRFGPLTLPPDLSPGEWRELTPDEVDALRFAVRTTPGTGKTY